MISSPFGWASAATLFQLLVADRQMLFGLSPYVKNSAFVVSISSTSRESTIFWTVEHSTVSSSDSIWVSYLLPVT